MSEGFEITVSVKFECGSKYSNWFMYFLVTNLQWFIKIITFIKSLAFKKENGYFACTNSPTIYDIASKQSLFKWKNSRKAKIELEIYGKKQNIWSPLEGILGMIIKGYMRLWGHWLTPPTCTTCQEGRQPRQPRQLRQLWHSLVTWYSQPGMPVS